MPTPSHPESNRDPESSPPLDPRELWEVPLLSMVAPVTWAVDIDRHTAFQHLEAISIPLPQESRPDQEWLQRQDHQPSSEEPPTGDFDDVRLDR